MFKFDICDFQRLDEIMKRTRKTDGSNKVDIVAIWVQHYQAGYFSVLKNSQKISKNLPFQKEEKASPLPHMSQKEVEGSRGKQNVDLSSSQRPSGCECNSVAPPASGSAGMWGCCGRSGQLLSLCPPATGKSQTGSDSCYWRCSHFSHVFKAVFASFLLTSAICYHQLNLHGPFIGISNECNVHISTFYKMLATSPVFQAAACGGLL